MFSLIKLLTFLFRRVFFSPLKWKCKEKSFAVPSESLFPFVLSLHRERKEKLKTTLKVFYSLLASQMREYWKLSTNIYFRLGFRKWFNMKLFFRFLSFSFFVACINYSIPKFLLPYSSLCESRKIYLVRAFQGVGGFTASSKQFKCHGSHKWFLRGALKPLWWHWYIHILSVYIMVHNGNFMILPELLNKLLNFGDIQLESLWKGNAFNKTLKELKWGWKLGKAQRELIWVYLNENVLHNFKNISTNKK